MSCFVVSVFEDPAGWYVFGSMRTGPFFSRERAVDLAEGMVAAICASGTPAELAFGPKQVRPFPPPQRPREVIGAWAPSRT